MGSQKKNEFDSWVSTQYPNSRLSYISFESSDPIKFYSIMNAN